jgi:hypothetical protein
MRWLGVGGAVAFAGPNTAASPSPSASPSSSSAPGDDQARGDHRRGPGGPGFGFGRLGGALHGELTVRKPGGGFQTVDVQRGTVQQVSGTAITVKSADNFTKTYAVTAQTLVNAQRAGIGSIKKGNEVGVVATVSGGTATAVHIFDRTLLQNGKGAFGPRHHDGDRNGKRGDDNTSPSPSPSKSPAGLSGDGGSAGQPA